MEKDVIKRNVNEDYIPIVRKEIAKLKYQEVDIIKEHQELISKINEVLNNDNISLFEVQDSFSCIFTGKPRAYSFCFPYDYSAAFVDSADYPKIYSQEEYNSEINKVREDYINKEKVKLSNEKEEGKTNDNLYKESIERITIEAEEKVHKRIEEIRSSFVKKSIRYIQAYEFYTALNKIKADVKNLMYSTEILGWTKFNYSINDDINVDFKSNFCYGRSAYFHITLVYKGVEILSYPKLVQYYYANMLDFIDCTESYKPNRQNWKLALSFVVDQANWAVEDGDAFVNKWVIDGTAEMIQGLKEILDAPNQVMDRLIKCNLDDSSLYAVRNITKDEIADYQVYRHEMTIAFQAEKITSSLLLIPNLKKLCSLYPSIKSIIEDVEELNREFFPKLDSAIKTITDKITSLCDKTDNIQKEYNAFKNKHYREFREYDSFKARNRDKINVLGEFIKIHPDFEIIYNRKNRYNNEIGELTIELKRLIKFKTQLSRCAQRICDYGLVNITNDDFLSTDKGLFSYVDGEFEMSKDRRRLFKFNNCHHSLNVTIPPTVRVICDNVFSNNFQIKDIKFPYHLKKIGTCVFQCCQNLQEIVLPNSVTEMGTDNFYACKSLKRVVLSSSMKEIPSWSFNNCSSLEQVVIPRSIKKIGNGAFKGCSSLISLSLPSSIEEIGDNIFENCEKIKKIYVPKNSKERFEKLLWQYKDKLIGTNG